MRQNLLFGTLALTIACSAPPEVAAPPSVPAAAWELADVHRNDDDPIRVLIIHDMEGLAGQSDPSSFDFGTELYPAGQEWLAADVNAVVEGLFAGGADRGADR